MNISNKFLETGNFLKKSGQLHKNKSMLMPSLKPEISPSDKSKVKVEVPLTNTIEASEDLVEIILTPGDPSTRKVLLASSASPTVEAEMPRDVNVVEKLGGGEIITRVSRKKMEELSASGFNIITNEEKYALPTFPEASKAKENFKAPFFRSVAELGNIDSVRKVEGQKATGKGVSIAILDTGVALHPDIKDKVIAFKDFVNGREEPYDDNGHGTHVAGDAAGTGLISDGKYKGTAPEASIVGVKVLNSDGSAKVSDIIRGIDWVVENRDKYNIRVINMSIGVPSNSFKDDPIHRAVERAAKAGIVVIAAAGNEGPKMGTVGCSPGNSPLAITVGALDDKNTPEKDDDAIASFSSQGPTADGLVKPDVVAPGVDIISLNVQGSRTDKIAKAIDYLNKLEDEKLKELPPGLYEGLGLNPDTVLKKSPAKIREYLNKHLPQIKYVNEYYVSMPGSSMAAPLTAGVVADMLEINPALSPEQVKDILKNTADDMGQKKTAQGAGSLDPVEAITVAAGTKGALPVFSKNTVGYLISGSGGSNI